MADFSSIFAPNPQCYLANSGGTNILLCREGCQGCFTSGCGKLQCDGKCAKGCGCGSAKRCGGCGKKSKKCKC